MSSFAMFSQKIGADEFGIIKKMEKKNKSNTICMLS